MDASVPDSDGQTPLFWVIQYKRVDIVMLLLQRQEVNPGTPDRNDFTPLQVAVGVRRNSNALHIAAAPGESEIVNLLLEQNGLDAASPDSTGYTPLHWAVRSRDKKYHPSLVPIYDDDEDHDDSYPFDELPGYREENLDIIKRLLARQEVNAGGHDQDGLTPLHHACFIADYEAVALLLQRQDVDPKARAINGQTPPHLAASHHQLTPELIKTLLEAGVPLDQESATGLTAFNQALCSGYWSVALLLLGRGADPMVSKRFKHNNSLLHIILKHSDSDDGKCELIERLIEKGIEVDTYTDTPVFDHRFNEDDNIEKAAGIRSPDILVGTDCTPLLLAATREYSLNNMKILLAAGADLSAHVIIGDVEFEGKTKGNRQAFLSGVLRHVWEPFSPGDGEILEHAEPIEVLLEFGSRLEFDGPADSPLQGASQPIMNSFRVARAALRARPSAIRVPLQRRTYAEAVPDKARFSQPRAPATTGFCSIYKSQDVVQVNIPAESGEMGVLANHVPSIEQLKPGLVEVVEESAGSKQFFLSGGFATVQPNSVLSINAVEGYPLEDFSAEAIRAQIAEAQKVANGSGSEQDIAEAKIELEVLETLSAHVK
ncbi:ATP synthase subunit delta, mitochondrial [Fusarium agapanthi]|uniref:ATP synthase subunit delta, mitochondrial n=4 Tax=Fusarium fujikuroi species complex TaxID=171627 RepID=A0A9P5BHH2_9HYPO|nr:ATP synthase subunit delta, mitochondrial [Fusarium agapanthi]